MNTLYITIGIAVFLGILLILGRGSSSQINLPENISDDDILDLALQGKKIQAIKYYRGLHGVGLKEAKEAVEEMMQNQ